MATLGRIFARGLLGLSHAISFKPQGNDCGNVLAHGILELGFSLRNSHLECGQPSQAILGENNFPRSGISTIKLSYNQAPSLALVHQIAHGLLAHACGLCQVCES